MNTRLQRIQEKHVKIHALQKDHTKTSIIDQFNKLQYNIYGNPPNYTLVSYTRVGEAYWRKWEIRKGPKYKHRNNSFNPYKYLLADVENSEKKETVLAKEDAHKLSELHNYMQQKLSSSYKCIECDAKIDTDTPLIEIKPLTGDPYCQNCYEIKRTAENL